ncbi:MAG: acylneuraminate cytidylyltransferase family protein [bacterium]|nr:acylneuraminate cytidylyltransferase family protein [bacterium]
MYKDKKILAIIPARGGSKGLPKKNIKLLLGKPLIVWSIEQALNSKYIDRVVVSTEDIEIAKIAKEAGADVPFLRPADLAKDETPTIDVVINVLENVEQNYDVVILLEPTSPIRKKNDIDNFITKLIDNYNLYDSLISLGEVYLENPLVMKKIDGIYVKPFLEVSQRINRRQDYPKVFFPYGVAYISKVDVLLKQKDFLSDRTGYILIEKFQCYEIDDIFDFLAVENILNYLLNKEVL